MYEYEFTLPASGKVVTWRPLKVKERLDIVAAFNREGAKHLMGPALLAKRVIRFDGKEGSIQQVDWGEWDDNDLESFGEEVERQEAIRNASFRKARAGQDIAGAFDSAVEGLEVALQGLAVAVRALKAAKDAESNRPLP